MPLMRLLRDLVVLSVFACSGSQLVASPHKANPSEKSSPCPAKKAEPPSSQPTPESNDPGFGRKQLDISYSVKNEKAAKSLEEHPPV